MKCPHCNQEHPEGLQLCPVTGNRIEQLKACTINPKCPDYGKYILPPDSRFCPTCGALLDSRIIEEEKYEFNPKKRMSSVDDFRHGNIIIDGVILGRTPARELKKFPKDYLDNCYRMMDGDVFAYGEISSEQMSRIFEISKQNDPQLVSAMSDRVYSFSVYRYKNIQFLKEMGFNKESYNCYSDEDEIVDMFENNGYVRIEPLVISEEWDDKVRHGLEFISKTPNAYGNYIELSFGGFGPLSIGMSLRREWTTYYDGVKHSI